MQAIINFQFSNFQFSNNFLMLKFKNLPIKTGQLLAEKI